VIICQEEETIMNKSPEKQMLSVNILIVREWKV
jgi:hypothetical protein